jgi:hypothetical protein
MSMIALYHMAVGGRVQWGPAFPGSEIIDIDRRIRIYRLRAVADLQKDMSQMKVESVALVRKESGGVKIEISSPLVRYCIWGDNYETGERFVEGDEMLDDPPIGTWS